MSEEELRDWVSRQLRIDSLPPEVWNELMEQGLVESALADYNTADPEDLLHDARTYYRLWRAGRASGGIEPEVPSGQEGSEGQESLELKPGEYEKERAAAYAEYRAKLMTDDPRVRDFREQNFGGEYEVLAPEAAERFLADGRNLGASESIGRRLARATPWTVEQATWFVLTGQAPETAPIMGCIERRAGKAYTHGAVTIEVEPWVSPDTVRDVYVRSQKKARGRNNRRVGARSMALFRFVVAQAERIRQPNLRERGARQKSAGRKGLGPPTEITGPSWGR